MSIYFSNRKGKCPMCRRNVVVNDELSKSKKGGRVICENEYGKHVRIKGEDYYFKFTEELEHHYV